MLELKVKIFDVKIFDVKVLSGKDSIIISPPLVLSS